MKNIVDFWGLEMSQLKSEPFLEGDAAFITFLIY